MATDKDKTIGYLSSAINIALGQAAMQTETIRNLLIQLNGLAEKLKGAEIREAAWEAKHRMKSDALRSCGANAASSREVSRATIGTQEKRIERDKEYIEALLSDLEDILVSGSGTVPIQLTIDCIRKDFPKNG